MRISSFSAALFGLSFTAPTATCFVNHHTSTSPSCMRSSSTQCSSSAKSDPVARDALERTAAHLQKLRAASGGRRRQRQQQEGSTPLEGDTDDTVPPDPLGEERERIYREYLQLPANALKAELKERKLPRSGRKPDLAMRLAENDLEEKYGLGDVKPYEKIDKTWVDNNSGDNDDHINERRSTGPLTKFCGLELSDTAAEALGRAGFDQPTPIQEASLERIARGESLILHAQTGSGKTLAYTLPVTEKLWTDDTDSFSVIMTPTRELAAQVAGIASVLAPPGSVRLVSRPTNLMSDGVRDRGEMPGMGGRFEATDARLFVGSAKAIMQSLYGDGKMPAAPTNKPQAMAFLQKVRYVVLDEVDRMLAVKKSRSDKKQKVHEKPAAVVASAVARLSLGQAQIVAASATVGRPLRREVARVLGLTPHECPEVVRGAAAEPIASTTTRAVTIPESVENYVVTLEGPSSAGRLLTTAYEVVQSLDSSEPKRVLLVLTRDFGISVRDAIGSMKHFGCKPEPRSLLDALEADGTEQMMEVHREVSGAAGVGQSTYFTNEDKNDGYFFITGEDTVRGLHLDSLDYVLIAGRPNGPDEYTHIAGRTGRAGRSGKVISILDESNAASLVSWERMLNVDFTRVSKSDVASLGN